MPIGMTQEMWREVHTDLIAASQKELKKEKDPVVRKRLEEYIKNARRLLLELDDSDTIIHS